MDAAKRPEARPATLRASIYSSLFDVSRDDNLHRLVENGVAAVIILNVAAIALEQVPAIHQPLAFWFHVFDAASHAFEQLVPGYFFRRYDDGRLGNASACGNEVASERVIPAAIADIPLAGADDLERLLARDLLSKRGESLELDSSLSQTLPWDKL